MAAVLALALIVTPVGAALAQDVKIETTPSVPPARERVIVPGPQRDTTRPQDADYYAEGTKVRYDPAFFEGLSVKTATGRAGFSGWTAPSQPVGGAASGFREVNGWFALGFSWTWDGPPTGPRPARPR